MKVILPPWRKTINERFIPLIQNDDRYLICWGGRGSSKSVFAAKKLIYRCLSEPYFRYILYRKNYNTIKDSQYQTIKDIVHEWGLDFAFTFHVNPMEIICSNGNKFICRGGDDSKKLKSIKDPTGVWYEEEIPDEGDFITITTSIRTQKAKYLQEIFTINPEVDGDHEKHWFWKMFFKGHNELSFSGITNAEMPSGKKYELKYTAHHSTWIDNRWIPDIFVAQLLELKNTNPYYYTIYALGIWGNKTSDGNFYKLFSRAKNVSVVNYNQKLPIHATFDFNVHPYVTMCLWQMNGKNAWQFDEICLATPKNRTDIVCREFAMKYRGHESGLFVYGDPAGLHEDTRTQQGYNDFMIIAKELATFRPQMRYHTVAPPVVMRGMFINEIFAIGYNGIELTIGDNCSNTINDYLFLKEAADGTKAKIKTKNPDTGVSYEQYGHTSDANDYFICSAFAADFAVYKRGPTSKISTGKNISKNSY